eukprot:GILI01003962.1.p1 GENE.GILI01003962.1~~GILI01003962.1.p1  ORF type:complete len:312 (-),score=70.69 GILI01003962.1:55-990(-)
MSDKSVSKEAQTASATPTKVKSKFKIPTLEELLRGISLFAYFFIAPSILLPLCILRVLHPLFIAVGLKNHLPADYIQRIWTLGAVKVMGLRVIVEGREHLNPNEPTLAMFSHGSNADAFIADAFAPWSLKFVGKKFLFRVPLFGWFGLALGHVPIDRGNLESAIHSLDVACQKIKSSGKSIAIAPEGTRRRSPSGGPEHLLPFKKGPFHLAKGAGCSITPVIIVGANSLWGPGQPFMTPGTIVLRYLPQLPKEVTQLPIEELQSKVREAMLKGYENLPPRSIHKEKPLLNCVVFWCLWALLSSWAVTRWVL